jgi:transcriptional antiterminator RfaH
VNNLRIVVATGENIEISHIDFQKGETLIIGTGPLIGLKCEMVEYNSRKMILVRIDLLKRNVLIELPATHLYRDLFPVMHQVRQ